MNTHAMNTHLSNEEIQDDIAGTLPTRDRDRVDEHLRFCRTCRSTHHALAEVDRALRALPVEQVGAAFTRNIMNRLPLVRKVPFAFRILEKLSSVFALFVVLAVLLTAFVMTGVIGVHQVNKGQDRIQEFFSGSASAFGSGVSSFSTWLGEYAPFAFSAGSLGITGTIFAVVLTLVLLDRILSKKLVQRIK